MRAVVVSGRVVSKSGEANDNGEAIIEFVDGCCAGHRAAYKTQRLSGKFYYAVTCECGLCAMQSPFAFRYGDRAFAEIEITEV